MQTSPRRRAISSDWRDIAQGIDCALQTDIQYGVYTVVSAADTEVIKPELYEELGYKPAWTATPDGMVPVEAALSEKT